MNEPIAVIGLSALFAGGETPDAFWRTIVSGKDCLTEVPDSHWKIGDYYDPDPTRPGKTYSRRGAFLGKVPFEPLGHGMPPNMVPSTDTAQLLALIVAERVLASCGGKAFERVDKDRTAVILGVASATELVSTMAGSLQRPVLAQALREEGFSSDDVERICTRFDRSYVDWTESTFPGLLGNVVAGRVANRFDLGGTNCVVDAACASSLGAIRMAMQELWSNSADMVITGGVDAINDIFMYMCFSKSTAMSRTGDCRPFAINADGTMLGEGIGMFVLRRLVDAERDGDSIYAVIRGLGSSSDGRAKSIYAPRPAGQAKALRRAYEAAGYSPATVELLEAHGTGTAAGDAAEVEALQDVFGAAGAAPQSCALGSIKSQIGHTKSAAGAASLYKTVMALHHKVLPATIKVEEPNPALGLGVSPFYVNTALRPWVRGNDHPRRAGVSAFGFGGSNFHLTVEEYRGAGPQPARIRTLPSELFLVSGATEREVQERARTVANAAAGAGGFMRAAHDSQLGFDASSPVRLAFVAANAEEVAEKARRAAPGMPDIAFGTGPRLEGGVAFLFPGQGSQYVGMGAGLAMAFEEAIGVWDTAATLCPGLSARVFPPPVFSDEERAVLTAELTATAVAQPALGVTEWMYGALLDAAGIKADFCAGHSFGEVSALFAAGVLSAEDFLAVANERGQLMHHAAAEHSGAMLAVVGSAAEIEPVLPGGVTVANRNSPQQVVLAGPILLIEETAATLSARGFTTRLLPVATAFHSPIVASAAEPFTRFLRGTAWGSARVPVYSNATSQAYPADAAAGKALLGGQLALPVLFEDQIEALYKAGARYFVEVGPGSVLTSLTAACLQSRAHVAIAMDAKGRDSVSGFWMGLARLAAAGIAFDTKFAWRDYELGGEAAQPSALAIPISGTNAGKKYPRPEEAPLVRAVATVAGAAVAPAIAVAPQVAAAPQVVMDERIAAVTRIQEQMAESHAATQAALSASHMAYLRATEAAFGLLGGGVPAVAQAVAPLPPVYTQPIVGVPVVAQVHVAPVADAVVSAAPVVMISSAPDLAELVMGIVAEKTGYPRDILQPEMDLEADLGIDSIKRVQILAAVCDARPDLPQADAKAMATLRTLGAILDYLGAAVSSASVQMVPPVAAAPAVIQADLTELVMGIVAEKTGYPRDILQPEMDLEADLGIDSIKRVQILAAVCDARPDLPQADAKVMATMRTLGAILEHLKLGEQPAGISLALTAAATTLPAWLAVNGLARLALRETAAAEGKFSPQLVAGSRVLVTGAPSALRTSVIDGLRAGGVLIEADGAEADGIVFVSGPPADGRSLPEQARLAFDAARRSRRGVFATVSLTNDPLRHALAALAKTLALEVPGVTARAISVEEGEAAQAVKELLGGFSVSDVILRRSGRATLQEISRPIGKSNDTALLQGKPVIVVSGGARGVTASCLKGLAEVAPLRLALFGRSPLDSGTPSEAIVSAGTEAELKAVLIAEARKRGDAIQPKKIAARARQILGSREIRATLGQLRQLGSEAEYYSCDVTDPAEVVAGLNEVRSRWGSIDGLIHGAGIVDDKNIADKSGEQFDRVFATKVLGLTNILNAVGRDNLRLLLIFSSVAGRYGNAGQVDYAMANATMCRMAHDEAERRGNGCLVRALGWGPWDGGMVTPDLRAHFERRGIPVIPLAQGVAAFVQELCHPSDDPADVDVVLAAQAPATEGRAAFH